jgi:predicted acyltransferase
LKKYGNEINSGSLLRIFRRVIAIFAIGLFLNVFPYFSRDYSNLRIMGVLQRIALAYGVGATICLAIRKEYLWLVTAVLLLLYWALLTFFGGADPYSLHDNFVLKTDLVILGKSHMYKGFGIPFEPEGVLSTIPSICTVIIGYFTGDLAARGSASGKTVMKLLLIGAGITGLGYLWGMVFPINKALWTSSYVLYSAGLAMIVLSVIYLIADVLKFKIWGIFFVVFGTNSLVAFALSEIWTKLMLLVIKIASGSQKISFYSWLYEKVCVPVAGNLNGSLMFGLIQLLLLWSVTLILYRRKIMIRL